MNSGDLAAEHDDCPQRLGRADESRALRAFCLMVSGA